jgi:hypothetical protein
MAYYFELTKDKDVVTIVVQVAEIKLAPEIKTCMETLKGNGWKFGRIGACDFRVSEHELSYEEYKKFVGTSGGTE